MRISRRVLLAICAALTAAVVTGLAAGALGAEPKHHGNSSHATKHHGNSALGGQRQGVPLIKESLAPSQPPPTDPPFHGVNPGGAPWALKFGDVRLKSDGHLDLRVKGLIIPSFGTPGPVSEIVATLYCGADSNHTAAAMTAPVPLSSKGDARIHDTSFSVPSSCLAPVILVQPFSSGAPVPVYIAVDGWQS
jgi:hypothetical protein